MLGLEMRCSLFMALAVSFHVKRQLPVTSNVPIVIRKALWKAAPAATSCYLEDFLGRWLAHKGLRLGNIAPKEPLIVLNDPTPWLRCSATTTLRPHSISPPSLICCAAHLLPFGNSEPEGKTVDKTSVHHLARI